MKGRLFVAKDPFLTISNISKANLIIDNSNPPPWLEQTIKASGGTKIKPQIKIELLLNESGKKYLSKQLQKMLEKELQYLLMANV